MPRSLNVVSALAFSIVTALPMLSSAATSPASEPPEAGERRPKGPPPEAVAACKDKSEGSACSLDFHGTAIDGSCRKAPDGNGPLACMPSHPPPPPSEAIEACIDKDDGDACTIQLEQRTIDGICRSLPEEPDLACVPKLRPRSH
jgi:hypothetical protein